VCVLRVGKGTRLGGQPYTWGTVLTLQPFEQLAFEDAEDSPSVPHGYFDTRAEEVELDSVPFGRVRIHVRVAGSGPALMLVHGFMTSSYSFRYVIAPLARHFTVYVPDLVGAGRSSKPDVSYNADALAVSIGETMKALGIRGARVVGNSLGGYLCMRLALRDHDVIGRLVNVHSPGIPTGRMHALRVALAITPGWRALVDWMVRRDPERWVHKNVHYFDETLKSREEHREYAAPLRTVEGRRAFMHMLKESLDAADMSRFARDLASLGGTFPIPLLMLYAKSDPMVPPIVGEKLHALLPNAEMKWVERASHFMHVDAPDAFIEASLPFLRG
jgi:pimeloyl-ACP methyl ester carboxylesterase